MALVLRPRAHRGPVALKRSKVGVLARNRVVHIGRSRWTSTSFALGLLAFVLTLVGLTFVASASSVSAVRADDPTWGVVSRQLVFVAVGSMLLVISSLVPYRIWWAIGPIVFGAAASATMYAALFGVRLNGSRRWIGLPGLLLQPSEFLKFGSVVMFSILFTNKRTLKVMGTWRFAYRTLAPLLFVALFPILKQPDMGTASIIVFAVAAIIVVAGMPWRMVGYAAVITSTVGTIYALTSDYRSARVRTFFDPSSDPTGEGWHVIQSKLGFASGRLFGTGIGGSRAKWGWVPNAHTDFVFAVIGEEVGLIGASIVVALFLAIAMLGFSVVNNARDRFGALLAAGITTWVLSQAVVNMGTVLGLVPVTGVPMPFVSSGGSSYLVLSIAFGTLINISRNASVPSDALDAASRRLQRNERRTRTAVPSNRVR